MVHDTGCHHDVKIIELLLDPFFCKYLVIEMYFRIVFEKLFAIFDIVPLAIETIVFEVLTILIKVVNIFTCTAAYVENLAAIKRFDVVFDHVVAI